MAFDNVGTRGFYLVALIVFIVGASLGSFVNVCVYRIPRGMSVVTPRSFCPSCRTILRWYELVPIVSYLFLRGRCRSCGGAISFRYPLIELISGGTLVLIFVRYGLDSYSITLAFFFMLLLIVFLIDWESLIIPNGIIVAGILIGVVLNLFISFHQLIAALGSALIAFLLMLLIRTAGNAVFKKETMGIGNTKLAALVGLFIGVQNFILAVWAAAMLGCLYWIVKRYMMGSPIEVSPDKSGQAVPAKDMKLPFGSFLSVTSFLVLLLSNYVDPLTKIFQLLYADNY